MCFVFAFGVIGSVGGGHEAIGAGANATHQQLQFGIFDATNPSGSNGSGDAIMFYLSSAGNVSNAVNGVNGGTGGITSTNNTPIASSGSAVTYYIELQRTSSSAIQAKVFSDASYGTQVGSTLSKTGLYTLTKTSAMSLSPNIRVNGIAPGPTIKNKRQSEKHFKSQYLATPLKQQVDVNEICNAVDFFIKNSSITGQVLAIDSGQSLNWQTPDIIKGKE